MGRCSRWLKALYVCATLSVLVQVDIPPAVGAAITNLGFEAPPLGGSYSTFTSGGGPSPWVFGGGGGAVWKSGSASRTRRLPMPPAAPTSSTTAAWAPTAPGSSPRASMRCASRFCRRAVVRKLCTARSMCSACRCRNRAPCCFGSPAPHCCAAGRRVPEGDTGILPVPRVSDCTGRRPVPPSGFTGQEPVPPRAAKESCADELNVQSGS